MDNLQLLKSRHSLERSCQARLKRCPVLACEQLHECWGPDDPTGHRHAHVGSDNQTWDNTRVNPDGTFMVTKVDWESRKTLEIVPDSEILQPIPGWWSKDLREQVEAWLAEYLNNVLLHDIRHRPMKEIADCMGSLSVPEGLQHIFDPPEVRVVDSCGEKYGGTAKGGHTITVSSWMTVDSNACKLLVPHELAHILNQRVNVRVSDPHGDEFKNLLRFITRQDDLKRYMGWTPNSYIEDLRLISHPGSVRLV